MSPQAWRMVAVGSAFLLSCTLIAAGVGALLDSRELGAYSFGALLLAGEWGLVWRVGLHPVNVEGQQLRYDPLVPVGISLLAIGATLGLAEHDALSWPVQLVGLVAFVVGWRRSDLPPIRRPNP